jgi:hypothetical protein
MHRQAVSRENPTFVLQRLSLLRIRRRTMLKPAYTVDCKRLSRRKLRAYYWRLTGMATSLL